MENRKQRLIDILKKKSLIIAKPGESFELSSGRTSYFYLDVRKTSLSPEGHHLLGNFIYQMITTHYPLLDAVAGVAIGGCPLASAVSYASYLSKTKKVPALYIRKETKDYGTRNLIEGSFHYGMNVVLVEDVVTSGLSSLRALNALTVAGAHTMGIIAVVDREEGAQEAFDKAKVPFHSLVKVSELL